MTLINQNLRCNDQIRISPVRLIGENNEQIGVVSTAEAMQAARDAGVDLVEVAPNVRPPVCRLMNYGRWKYNQKKHQKKHHELQLKEVRLRPKTDTNDRNIKLKRAQNFLGHGHKVQFTMVFRGREQSHREIGYQIFKSILEDFGERVKIERSPSMEGRRMVMVVSPNKGAFSEEKARGREESKPEQKPAQQPEPAPTQPQADAKPATDADAKTAPTPAETH